ncbi:MAG: DUF2905 domain-containing protein [Candidatus Thiodiazotropha sp.]
MQKILIIAGLAAILIGLLWPWLGRLPLGKLPGDIIIQRENFRLYLPLTSMILLSGLISLLLWLFRR